MANKQPASQKTEAPDRSLAFDVGYSSIGWAVLQRGKTRLPEILGCGVVTFAANDCLASQRRDFRRQRRHIRSTRRRIQRIEQLLAHLGAMGGDELAAKHAQAGGHSAPWLLAARVLHHGTPLSWSELWDVIRWYAHNRGYDGNRRWSAADQAQADEDTEKEENAKRLMRELGTQTMSETFCRFLDVDPEGTGRTASQKRFKGLNAAFPRRVVEGEVRTILETHVGKLPHLDQALVGTLMDDGRLLPCPAYKLPKRFEGGLLFGQSVPRFDNRIISICPVSGGKVCSKNSPEFLRFRWLMLLANVRIDRLEPALTQEERGALDQRMQAAGSMTPGEFKAAVKEVTGSAKHNLEAMLLHPDAGKALVLDPLLKLLRSDRVNSIWPHLPERIQKRARGQWRKGRTLTIRQMAKWCGELGADPVSLLEGVGSASGGAARGRRKSARPAIDPLNVAMRVERLAGRAPFARQVLVKACEEVLAGFDPRKKCKASDPQLGEDKAADGALVTTDAMVREVLDKPIDKLTNNHLVRHRLLILQRLVADIVADPALGGGDPSRVAGVTIEINSEIKELSGKNAKQIEQDLGRRLGNFKSVVRKLESAGIPNPSPGLIRKARVAEDLGWTCPYTGRQFSPQELLHVDQWDKDHIVPYSDRPSNSLDSLVITTKQVNLAKKNRTALEFIEQINLPENQAERDRLGVWTPRQYLDFVEGLYPTKADVARFRATGRCFGHRDDFHRKQRRKHLLLLPKWEDKDKGFLPRDLTVTSHLTRLGAMVVRRTLPHLEPHEITSLPGSVTAAIRTGWKLLGCLAAANPGVVGQDGRIRTKTEVREITHLHHALDAIVIALTNHYFPKNGRLWEAMVRREKQRGAEDNALLLATGLYKTTQHGVVFADQPPPELTDQVRARLAEKRVLQHIAADMGGLGGVAGLRLEQNQRGVVVDGSGRPLIRDGKVKLCRRDRDVATGSRPSRLESFTWEKQDKLLGWAPPGAGKLAKSRAVLVNDANYGIAILDENDVSGAPRPVEQRLRIIRWCSVWKQIQELKKENGGKTPRIIRNGQMIYLPKSPRGSRTDYSGFWVVESVKDNQTGPALDMVRPDCVKAKNGVDWAGMNKDIAVLVQNGVLVQKEIHGGIRVPYSGFHKA